MMKICRVPPEVVWPVRHEVMYPQLNVEDIKLESDSSSTHLALIKDQKVISVVSLVSEGNALQFRKFATLETYQRKGYGSKLLKHLIDFAKTEGYRLVWCNARTSAASFYKRFGFKETETTFYKGGHDYVIMELTL